MGKNVSELERNTIVLKGIRYFIFVMLAILSLPFQGMAGTVTTSLLDISNWNITQGLASMNNGMLTVGPDGTPYRTQFGGTIQSKQSFTQPFSFTWKGYFPTTSINSAQSGFGQAPFSSAGDPTINVNYFVSSWNQVPIFISNAANTTVSGAVQSNNSFYGEYSITWQNNIISWCFNGSKVSEKALVSSDKTYLYFHTDNHQFKIESISVTTEIPAINGVCGTANGTTFAAVPTYKLLYYRHSFNNNNRHRQMVLDMQRQ